MLLNILNRSYYDDFNNESFRESVYYQCGINPYTETLRGERIPGVSKFGSMWLIPKDTKKPLDKRKREVNVN